MDTQLKYRDSLSPWCEPLNPTNPWNKWKTLTRTLRLYYPHPKFPSVSVTGAECCLNCEHCGGHYLVHMPDVSTPEKLKEFAFSLVDHNGVGMLVSGGSTSKGKVPLSPFISTLRWIKENTDLILNIHTGLVNKEEAESIASTGADIASVDLVGSDDSIKRVYGLDAGFKDYSESLYLLKDAGMNVAPHLTIGLDFGEILGEDDALKVALAVRPEVIVINALIPTIGTGMADVKPLPHNTIFSYLQKALDNKFGIQISMGCMRPRKNKPELEKAAIIAGIHRLAIPSNSTLKWLEEQEIKTKIITGCCAIPLSLENRALKLA